MNEISQITRSPTAWRARRRVRKRDRVALIRRMMRAAELEVLEIERRLAASGLAAGAEMDERNRKARVLAILARTLRELIALDAAERNDQFQRDIVAEDGDAPPRDLDELRRELARRLARIRAGSHSGIPCEPEGT